jgi:PAS domain S-box-containing protein
MSIDFSLPAEVAAELAALRNRVMRLERLLVNYEQLVQGASDAIVLLDASLRVRLWNHAAEELYGLPAGSAIGLRWSVVFPEMRYASDHSRQELIDLLDEGGSWEGELAIMRADGDEIYVEAAIHHVGGDRGEFGGLGIVCRDITARKRAEQERHEQAAREQADVRRRAHMAEARYRTLIEHLPMAIYMADLEDINSASYVSPQIEALMGYTPEEWLADPTFWMTRLHPDDYHRIVTAQARFQATLEPTPMHFRLLTKDGRVVWVYDEPTIVRDDAGKPLFLLGFTQDITARKQAEAARDQLAAIVAASDEAISATDLRGVVLSWNAGAERIYGYSAAEMIGGSISRIVPPEQLDEVRMIAETIRGGERVEQFESVRVRKDGAHIVTLLTGSPIFDESGHVVAAAFVARDITARKRAEEAERFLAQVGALLAASLDYATTLGQITRLAVPRLADGCSVYIAGEDGQVRQLADAHLTPETEAIARELDRRYPADPQASDGLALVMRTGKTLLVPEITDRDLLLAARDEQHLALMRAQGLRSLIAIPLLARDHVLGVITFSAETPRRRFDAGDLALAEELARRAALAIENERLYREAQRALRRQEEALTMLDALLDNTPIGLGFLDADFRFMRVNDALLTIGGQPAAAYMGRTVREVYPHLASTVEPLLEHVRDSGLPLLGRELGFESRIYPGLQRTFLVSLYPIGKHEQAAWGIGMAVIEITERKQAEEAHIALERKLLETQKLESLGVLAGGIAHDFNNLLVAILGNAELALLDLPAGSPAADSIKNVQVASRRAAELTGQMLAYSGRGRFKVEPVQLSALVDELAALLHASIPKRVLLQTDLAPNLPLVDADATQLRQVVMNLVINAAEAIGESGGVVMIATSARHADTAYLATTYLAPNLPPGQYVALEIADTGAGMDQATLDRIFEPFFTTKFTGRGLGMAAVLGIVRGHHGALKIDSAPGRGTTVTVLLPVARGPEDSHRPGAIDDGDARPLAPSGLAPELRRYAPTVLVVDDEQSVREISQRVLERLGYNALVAEDGTAGLALYRANAPSIAAVLLDLTMPQMSGEEVYQTLCQTDPDARVVVMSGYSADEIRMRFPASARLRFLQKPFTPTALDQALREITGGQP